MKDGRAFAWKMRSEATAQRWGGEEEGCLRSPIAPCEESGGGRRCSLDLDRSEKGGQERHGTRAAGFYQPGKTKARAAGMAGKTKEKKERRAIKR